jgi:hypothetical protein
MGEELQARSSEEQGPGLGRPYHPGRPRWEADEAVGRLVMPADPVVRQTLTSLVADMILEAVLKKMGRTPPGYAHSLEIAFGLAEFATSS